MPAQFDLAFLDAVLHTIPGGVFVYDCEARRTVFATRAFYELLGFADDAEPLDMSLLQQAVVHDDDRAAVRATLERAASLPRHQHAEVTFRMRLADGGWRWLCTRGAPLFLSNTASSEAPARYLVGVAEDVSQRRQAEEELQQSADSLRLAQELANVGSYDRNLRDGTVHWSEQMFRIHGADPVRDDPNVMGDLIERFVHPDDRSVLRRAMRQLATTGRAGPACTPG